MEMYWRSIALLLLLVGTLHTCTGQSAITFCDNVQPVGQNEVELVFQAGQEGRAQCTCLLSPVGNGGALLDMNMKLNLLDSSSSTENNEDSVNKTCEPFAAVVWGGGYLLSQCARKGSQDADSEEDGSRFLVQADNYGVTLTLHNHLKKEIAAHVRVSVPDGQVNVECFPEMQSTTWDADTCPCNNQMFGPGGMNPDSFAHGNVSNNQTGLTVGLVCVAIFILLLVIVAGIWWWRKRSPGAEKDLEGVTAGNTASENPAYSSSTTASRASGIDRAAEPDTHYANVPGKQVPFENDPELDLSLRTAPNNPKSPNKGSVDSGMYSMPTEKPPNNNYTNLPLGPDQMYNPMLVKQPSIPSLTGQGALQGSVDHLNPPDVLYAQPNKNKPSMNGPPTRSASHDALNQRPAADASGDLAAARSRSHNTSMASVGSVVETDV